jgi:3-hydroxyacyl-[acyl-carrier-protein] dehydratase
MSEQAPGLDIRDIIRILPQKPPAVVIDRVLEVEPDGRVIAQKNFTVSEPVFNGYYPGLPVLPASYLVEAMVQTCCVLIYASEPFEPSQKVISIIGLNKMKFRRSLRPGDTVEIDTELLRKQSNVWRFKVQVFIDDSNVCEGEMALSLQDREDII